MSELSVTRPLPLEHLQLGTELDGTYGTNRNTGNGLLIDAHNDLEALNSWLEEFKDSPQTYRNYRKEIERLLLWSLLVLNKPFSSLSRDDLRAYEEFLVSPTPTNQWCGPRRPRHSDEWRPFLGPLSESSRHQALVVIGAAFGYLSDAGYLLGNPVKLLRRKKAKSTNKNTVERFLEQELWNYVWEFIEGLPEQSLREREHKARIRFLFHLLYLLGPRVSEVANLQMSDFRESRGKWWCYILGKGNKRDKVPVNDSMLSALIDYRRFLDLSDLPKLDEHASVLRSVKGSQGISSNMIYRIVKKIFGQAADSLEFEKPEYAFKLRKASTHWMRHTAMTHLADQGVDLHHIRQTARHSDINTTSRYVHSDEELWHNSVKSHNP
ncbi:tyrosine-type recombinase/integrase [Pleionea mediterranea]|uniref:Site-specific recombinase XerD n=1 Tax=Pleionea mediterranea TaxID=523701 RepID=A0A316FN06_9GAMM|nr:site-specific integrase [Pleionea mediterranea]PWK49889.1 site-specific recombinase XerD [Pleionea mediterranea]